MLAGLTRIGTRQMVLSDYGRILLRAEAPIQGSPDGYLAKAPERVRSMSKNKQRIMQIVAVIEKGSDGFFSIRSEQKVGRYYFGGYGESVKAAKEDFVVSVKESLEGAAKEGSELPSKVDISFKYDIPSFFNYFDYLNVSKFAEFAGINESRMRAYKSGLAYPGEKTTRKILKAIETIGREISAARFA